MALIKCPECGREISDKAASCVGCGCPINHGDASRERDKPETILMQGLCNQCGGFAVKNGTGILTNHRFLYLKHSLAKIAAVGVLTYLTRGSYEYEIPLDAISSIEDGRHGISRTLVITTRYGETFNYYFTNREEWRIKLESARAAF